MFPIALAADATTVVALIIMLRNVVYLLSQRSAIAARASRTWWRTARTRLRGRRPPVLREDRRRSRSRARRRPLGRRAQGPAAHPSRSPQSGPAGPRQKLPPPGRPRQQRSRAKRGLPFKKGKRHSPSLTSARSLPGGEVYLMQIQGNSISHTAADLGF